jgi:hypothetical protein
MGLTASNALISIKDGAAAPTNVAAGAIGLFTPGNPLIFALQSMQGIQRAEMTLLAPGYPGLHQLTYSWAPGQYNGWQIVFPQSTLSNDASVIAGIGLVVTVTDSSGSSVTAINYLESGALSLANPTFTGVVNNNATLTVLGNDAKSKPQTATGSIATSTAAASTALLYTIAVGEVASVDVILEVNVGSPGATTIAAWKFTALYFGAAGPVATISGTILSQTIGGGAATFPTPPTLVVSGAGISLQVTSPDTTARTWSYEAHVLRGLL